MERTVENQRWKRKKERLWYDKVEVVKTWKEGVEELLGEIKLEMEGNYNVKTCGIGCHGDGERKKVCAANLSDDGVAREIRWQW